MQEYKQDAGRLQHLGERLDEVCAGMAQCKTHLELQEHCRAANLLLESYTDAHRLLRLRYARWDRFCDSIHTWPVFSRPDVFHTTSVKTMSQHQQHQQQQHQQQHQQQQYNNQQQQMYDNQLQQQQQQQLLQQQLIQQQLMQQQLRQSTNPNYDQQHVQPPNSGVPILPTDNSPPDSNSSYDKLVNELKGPIILFILCFILNTQQFMDIIKNYLPKFGVDENGKNTIMGVSFKALLLVVLFASINKFILKN